MTKFAVEVEEIVRYRIEVEGTDRDDALRTAECMFFDSSIDNVLWQYSVQTNFDDPLEVVE
jgi:hypothetical protein